MRIDARVHAAPVPDRVERLLGVAAEDEGQTAEAGDARDGHGTGLCKSETTQTFARASAIERANLAWSGNRCISLESATSVGRATWV